jgi:hypothetical protein
LEVALPGRPSDEELVTERFGMAFPPTVEMSAFARNNCDVDWRDPDTALKTWLEREEELFRALERRWIDEVLAGGIRDADHFVDVSLTVQNRRKSRMGHALQHHLGELFRLNGLHFTSQGRTERGNRPDFLFPGETQYHDPRYDAGLLTMLAAKSTLKDRWRQVLAEADRIPDKHLCTLQLRLTEAQTDEMRARHVVLVIPTSLQVAYTPEQCEAILGVASFIEFVAARQERSGRRSHS